MELKNKISYITPKIEFLSKKIILDESYSQEFQLSDGNYIEVASDIGKRKNQQDSLTIAENNGYVLLLVADGVGGFENGELASYTTANIINKWFMSEYEDTLKILSSKTFSVYANRQTETFFIIYLCIYNIIVYIDLYFHHKLEDFPFHTL
mgnify:CR=1 FL=1